MDASNKDSAYNVILMEVLVSRVPRPGFEDEYVILSEPGAAANYIARNIKPYPAELATLTEIQAVFYAQDVKDQFIDCTACVANRELRPAGDHNVVYLVRNQLSAGAISTRVGPWIKQNGEWQLQGAFRHEGMFEPSMQSRDSVDTSLDYERSSTQGWYSAKCGVQSSLCSPSECSALCTDPIT